MNQLANLAKLAVESYVKERKIIEAPKDFPKEFFERRAGTFVTIEKDGELRGCIGTYAPARKNIIKEIIYNAVAASTKDYRFGPIQENELPFLSYTVYVLSGPELVKNPETLDPKKYGVMVKASSGFKCGLLLPNLDGVDTVDQQIAICCQKGGINPKQEKITIYRFTVEKYQ